MLQMVIKLNMKDNVKFYTAVGAVVLAVVVPSVMFLGGFGLLVDCVIFGAVSCLID